jgi:spermidine synthase
LVIGLASGITVGTVATHPVEHIRISEVEGEMVRAARLFGPYNHNVLDDPRVTISINDARNELQFNPQQYDVIVSEPSNPWMTVASNLFTAEFFALGRARLRPGGLFCQWIQTYCLTPPQLKSILAGFHRAFPYVLVFGAGDNADLVVLGSDRPAVLDLEALEGRMSSIWVRSEFARTRIHDALDVVSTLQTGGEALAALVRGADVNSDDNGLIEFAAPKALFLETRDQNIMALREGVTDPMSPVVTLAQSTASPDALRLELIRRWVRRDHKRRASLALPYFTDTVLKSEASALLRTGNKP